MKQLTNYNIEEEPCLRKGRLVVDSVAKKLLKFSNVSVIQVSSASMHLINLISNITALLLFSSLHIWLFYIDKPVDCKWSEYGQWSECNSNTCKRTRKRTVIQIPRNGGKDCEGKEIETEPCTSDICGEDVAIWPIFIEMTLKNSCRFTFYFETNVQIIRFHFCILAPPINCKWSSFGEWTQCTTTCGAGLKQRSRTVLQEAINDGRECVGCRVELEICNVQECPLKGKLWNLLNHRALLNNISEDDE